MGNKTRSSSLAIAIAIVCLLAIFAILAMTSAMTVQAAPAHEAIKGISTVTFANARVLSGTAQITYTTNPLNVRGTNIAKTAGWFQADVFVTADVSGTATVTVTPQVSADGVNWTDATYNYVATNINVTTITSTGTLTSTMSGSSSRATATPSIVLSSDDTEYFNMALAGEYLRFAIGYNGRVTATIQVTLKNTSN